MDADPTIDDTIEQELSPTHLYAGDTGTLTGLQRRAFAQLIRGPFISSTKDPEIFRTVSDSRRILAQQLDNLFLSLVVDDTAGVAYAKHWDPSQMEQKVSEQRTLFRKVNLTFEQTIVLLHLRRELVKTNPTERTVVDEDEVFEATAPYQSAKGTDQAAQRKAFTAAWNKLKENSILIKTPTEGRYEVSPVLRIIFSGEQIAAVTASYERLLAEKTEQSEEAGDE